MNQTMAQIEPHRDTRPTLSSITGNKGTSETGPAPGAMRPVPSPWRSSETAGALTEVGLKQQREATDEPPADSIGRCNQAVDGLENPFKNCGFERGLTDWTTSDVNEPFMPLAVASSGASPDPLLQFFSTQPTEGTQAAVSGLDGIGPGTIKIAQTVKLPRWTQALLFDYRTAWDFALGAEAKLDRALAVTVRSTSGDVIALHPVKVAKAGSFELDSGPQRGSVDLSTFAGSQVEVAFEWNIPESKTGPGWFQLDNVRLELPRAIGCGSTVSSPLLTSSTKAQSLYPSWFRLKLRTQPAEQSVQLNSSPGEIQIEHPHGEPWIKGLASAKFSLHATNDLDNQGSNTKIYLVSVRPSAKPDPRPRHQNSVELGVHCVSGNTESFEDAGRLNTSNDDVGSAQWHNGKDCPAATLPGHSGLGVARWGNPSACTNYATAGGTTDQLVVPIQVGVHHADNNCPGSRQQLVFDYFLDLEDTAEFDRVRVSLHFAEGLTSTVLSNSALSQTTASERALLKGLVVKPGDAAAANGLVPATEDTVSPGLTNTGGQWRAARVTLPSPSVSSPLREVRFTGETDDDLNNWGRGFLVDDVRIECSPSVIGELGFESSPSPQRE